MAYARAAHLITVGSKTYTMVLPDVYLSNGSAIGAVLGITKVSGPVPAGTEPLTLKAGLNNGQIFHLAISYKVAGKRKRAKIVCSRDSIGAGLGLVGTNYLGQPITGAVIPEHLTFS